MLTLTIEKEVLEKNFSLKDASAYNVQFIGSHPIFIDTLSFEPYEEGPWVAFGQFCKHFLYPLMLMSKVDLCMNTLLKNRWHTRRYCCKIDAQHSEMLFINLLVVRKNTEHGAKKI